MEHFNKSTYIIVYVYILQNKAGVVVRCDFNEILDVIYKKEMHVPTLNLRIQVLPAFAPLNRKKKFVKECLMLNVESNLFTLHLERVQLPKRVVNSLPNILKIDDSDEARKVKENNEHIGKSLKCLATFSVGAIPLSWKQSVMFAVISDTNPEDKLQSSAKFSQFLNFLVEINQNLIIDLNGELAILQPMSSSLATLTCLKEAFHGPMKKLFELQNVQHLSKKMVATLLDEVMSLKNNLTVSQQDEGSERNAVEPLAEVSLVNPVRTNQKSVKLGRTQSNRSIGSATNQVETGIGNVSMGPRRPKRPLEDPDGMKSPKRMKKSYESPQKNQTLRPSKLSRTKSAASWRGQLILEKSKEMRQKSFMADDDGSSCLSTSQGDSFGKSGNNAATSPSGAEEQVINGISELKTKEDLLEFLHKMYEKAFEEEGAPVTAAQNIVRAAIQYFARHVNSRENCSNNGLVLEETYKLLTENILSNNLQIRDKYMIKSTQEVDEFKLKELQLQCLLYCEVDSACSSTKICCDSIEPRHEKVVAMLRTMSFIKDTNFLSMFLNTSMLENYHRSSPRFLYKIYDSLIHPLPIQLEYLMSPDKLEDDFLLASPINTESIASLITNPKVESNEMGLDQLLQMEKQTRLSSKNQRSISFTQAPRMKIELPSKKAPQQQRRSERIAGSTKLLGDEEKDHKSKVRRSLFNDNRSPEPSPNKKHQTPVKTMPAHYVLKTKQVKETPVGRQGVNRYLRKQEKLLQNLSSSDVTFVEETPEKDSGVDASFTQPEAKLDISASFYSTKHMTARFAHLEKRMTETRPEFLEQIPVQLSLSQVAQPLKSPKRRVTARMLFGSPVSPSPQKSVLKTIVEEKMDYSGKTHKSPQSPPFRSPRRQQQTFKTPENVKSPKTKDMPEKLLKVRRAILMTPSPTRKSSGPKITSPKSLGLRTPSPRKLTAANTPRKS